MTKQEVAILSFKALGIYALIHAFNGLPNLLYSMSKSNLFDQFGILNVFSQAVPFILIIFSSILLWYCAPLLSSTIFKSRDSEIRIDASLHDVQIMAFSIIGLFVIANALTDITKTTLFNIFLTSFSHDADSEIKTYRNFFIILLATKISFGLWLLLGSRGIVNFIKSMRRD